MKMVKILFVICSILILGCEAFATPYYCPPSNYKYDSATAFTHLYDTEYNVCEQYRLSTNFKPLCGYLPIDGAACFINNDFHRRRYQAGKCKKIDIKYIDEPDCKGYVYLIKGTDKLVDRFMTSGGDACVAKIKAMYPKSND